MNNQRSQQFALLACGLLFVLLHCAAWTLVAQIVSASGQPNAQTRLLPPHEWEFSELDSDGSTSVTIERKYGFIEVSTTHPR